MINNSNKKVTKSDKRQQEDYRPTWSGLKNPRIVRVSRAFGGKDRHSKVTTVRGLRDRRVRLSVQTAIQLYDLQDKLGFSQPSKVVDWLINAAQHEIDKLPPLQIPPGNFFPTPQLVDPWNTAIADNNRTPVRHPQCHMANAVPEVKNNFVQITSNWNSDVYSRIKSNASGDHASTSRRNDQEHQSIYFPNTGSLQLPYNISEASNSYACYSGNHPVEAFHPMSLFATNFDGKHYGYLTMSALSGSEGNLELRNENTHQKH
ncbi:hypothetical protein LUZ63_018442 [Rhynchospora breviuscula]|uniref:TCP domain-containing protein n=1 Tax=Rhynchospora breviuscula TaxID=2022672 RepID=A0A9Q0C4F9_9POAL|nr:hypothetical protein LUZ63_018442 [Rhynchospora breviuscula]